MQLNRKDAIRLIGLATTSGPLCKRLRESVAGLDHPMHQEIAVQINNHLF